MTRYFIFRISLINLTSYRHTFDWLSLCVSVSTFTTNQEGNRCRFKAGHHIISVLF